MRIKILAVGRRMPAWVDGGIADYKRRIRDISIDILEVPLVKRSASQSISKAMACECEKLLTAVDAGAYIVALDQLGLRITSEQLATQLARWMQHYRTVAFLIGGSDGLANQCKTAAHKVWSLSDLTLPHALARLVLVEQLYRAWTILKAHPYHRR